MTTTPLGNFLNIPDDNGQGISINGNGNNNSNGNITDSGRTTDQPFGNYDTTQMAKDLYADAGLEWPSWAEKPGGNDATTQVDSDVNSTDPNAANQTSTPSPNESTTPAPTATSTVVKIGDREIPVSQAEAIAQWYEWLQDHPEKANTVIAMVRGQGVIPPAPTMTDKSQTQSPAPAQPTLQIPEGLDLDTPRDKFFFERLTEIQNRQQQLAELTQQQIERAEIARQEAKAQADMREALAQFQGAYNLSSDELNQVRQKAAELNIVGGLVARNPQNAPAAIMKALEAGMWNVEAIRNKLLNNPQPTTTPDKERQAKLSALSSASTGSAPRTESRPRLDSDAQMKDVIAKAIEPMWNQ